MSALRRIALTCVVPLTLAALLATPATAHARLVSSEPPATSTSGSVNALSLSFSEPVEIAFSKVEVIDDGGHNVELGPVGLAEGHDDTLTVQLKSALLPGDYAVNWAVTAADGHKTSGTYSIRIAK